MNCPVCGEAYLAGDRFCENCSADLSLPADQQQQALAQKPEPEQNEPVQPDKNPPVTAPACATCGGRIATDGYCETCGAPAVKERDHWTEHPAPWVAAVCDRGLKHSRNEDAMAISASPAQGELAALVVCDGVSSSTDPDLASLAAARAARDLLIRPATRSPSIAGRISGWTDQLTAAAQAAGEAVLKVTAAQADSDLTPVEGAGSPADRPLSPPSCTFVAAVVDGPVIVAGWIGDSRAYWLPDAGPAQQLSTDDSWATEQIRLGVPREQAEASPQAHAITRWLGQDSPSFEPRCSTAIPDGPGWLLVCSDGLWNYCSGASDMSELVRATAARADGDIVATASELVGWANQQGGHDNITVALARLATAAETAEDPPGRDAVTDQPAGQPPGSLEPDPSSGPSER